MDNNDNVLTADETTVTTDETTEEAMAETDAVSDQTEAKTVDVEIGSAAWAMSKLAGGERVMREAWVDNHHIDPAHIRGGIRLSREDVLADDWKTI